MDSLMKKFKITAYYMHRNKTTRKPTGTGFLAFATAEDGRKVLVSGPDEFYIFDSFAHSYYYHYFLDRDSHRQ